MTKDKERINHTIEFLKWIKNYNGWWQLICTPNDEHMNLSMMKLLIERLEKESFYEIIFVLLSVHKNEKFMSSIYEAVFKDLLIAEWKAGNKDDIIKNLISYLE